MTRIPASIEQTAREYLVYLYNAIRERTSAPPGEVLSLISRIIVDISRNEQSIEFESRDLSTQMTILSTRIEAVEDTLYNGTDGKSSELADFFELASHIGGYSMENVFLIYSTNTMDNVPEWFTDLRTEEEWKGKGMAVVSGALPVYLMNSDGTAPVRVYDCIYVTDYKRPGSARDENLYTLIDHDVTTFLRYSGIGFVQNEKIDVRLKYDGRNDRILFRHGKDHTELYRYMIKSVADAYINQEVEEGGSYGITGYYDLASDIVAYIVSARRGITYNDIMNERIRSFHRIFHSENRESFFDYLRLILKVADRISSLLAKEEMK